MGNASRRFYLKYQGFTFPVILIVVATFIIFFVIVPVTKSAITMFSDAKVISEEVDTLKQKIAILQQLDEATLERQLIAATAAIPIDKSLPTILRTVEGVSAQSQVTITNLAMDQPGTLSTASARALSEEERRFGMFLLPFSASITGTFEQVKAFLQLSTQVRRFVRAKAFSVNFVDTTGDGNQLTTQISFDSFYAPLIPHDNSEEISPLVPLDEKTLSNLVGYPNVGEISLSQASVQPQGLISRDNPFSN